MADDKKDAAKPAEGDKAPVKKKNPKLLILISAAAVLVIGGGAAAYFLTRAPAPAADEAAAKDGKDAKKGEKDKKGESKKPFFVDFEMFTVNLKDPEKFLQIKLTFQVGTAEHAEALKDLMPKVRSAVIPVLSQQDAAEIMTPEGKEKMCAQLAEAANKALAGGELADAVDAVLITHMIIQ
jgi:flagellar FliL protein